VKGYPDRLGCLIAAPVNSAVCVCFPSFHSHATWHLGSMALLVLITVHAWKAVLKDFTMRWSSRGKQAFASFCLKLLIYVRMNNFRTSMGCSWTIIYLPFCLALMSIIFHALWTVFSIATNILYLPKMTVLLTVLTNLRTVSKNKLDLQLCCVTE
jgi:hypothetical protein